MVHNGIRSRNQHLHIHDRATARRDISRLHKLSRRTENIAVTVELSEITPDDMERARQVRTSVAKEDTDGIAHASLQRLISGQRSFAPVKDDDVWLLTQRIGVRELHLLRQASVVVDIRWLVVELALHYVVFVVHGGGGRPRLPGRT